MKSRMTNLSGFIVHVTIVLFLLAEAESKVTVLVTLHRYDNPTGRLFDGGVCDIHSGCDPIFKVCLDPPDRNFRGYIEEFNQCKYFEVTSRAFDNTGSIIVFDTGEDVNGLANPIEVNISDWKDSVYIRVLITDYDHGLGDQIIDAMQWQYNSAPQSNMTEASPGVDKIIRGVHNKATVSVNVLSYCAQYYYHGSGVCDRHCKPRNDSLGHYSCSHDGMIVCLPGWLEEDTLCVIPEDDCLSHRCVNGGTCIDQERRYTCICPPEYTGTFCETTVDPCLSKPCANGGVCRSNPMTYWCDCASGWTGQNCTDRVPPQDTPAPFSEKGVQPIINDNLPLIIGLVVGIVILLAIVCLLVGLLLRRNKKRKQREAATGTYANTAAAGQQTYQANSDSGTSTYDNPLFSRPGAEGPIYAEVDDNVVKVPLPATDVDRAPSSAARLKAAEAGTPIYSLGPEDLQNGGLTSPMGVDDRMLYRNPDAQFANPTYDAPEAQPPMPPDSKVGLSVKQKANLYDEPIKFKK